MFYRTPWLDPIVSLTYASAVTTRVRLGTSTLVMPTRHPVLLAKELSTLQALSRDRFILGVGTGWDEREFEAVGMRKSERGARTDEAVELVRRLLAERARLERRAVRAAPRRRDRAGDEDEVVGLGGRWATAAARRVARASPDGPSRPSQDRGRGG